MMKNMERQENIHGDPDFILLHDENSLVYLFQMYIQASSPSY